MNLNRRHLALSGAAAVGAVAFGAGPALAVAMKPEESLAAAVEAYRKAMIANDKAQLDALTDDHLSYGHSSGRLQTKAEVSADAASGKSVWKSLTFDSPAITVAGRDGIVRCTLTGVNESQGKANDIKIGMLMVWRREKQGWKLLARQGFKI